MFGLLALLATTGARAGVLDAIIVPSATVEIPEANSHEANFSTPVELAISADGSTVTAGGVDLHAEWLRERCQSESSVDVNTLQLLRNPHEYATRAEAGRRRGDLLRVRFADGHESTFSLSALAAERGREERGGREHLLQVNEHALPEVRVWEKNLTAPPAFEYASLAAGDAAALQQLLGQLLSVGVVLIRAAAARGRVQHDGVAPLDAPRDRVGHAIQCARATRRAGSGRDAGRGRKAGRRRHGRQAGHRVHAQGDWHAHG